LVRKKIAVLFIGAFILLCGLARADFESEVVDLVNLERAAQGLHPLTADERLATAARDHSSDMGLQGYFSHDSLDGRQFFERILDAGYAYNYCGENIAAGYATPEMAVQGWMNSPGHRANILEPQFCDIGVGYVYVAGSPYGHYWTQDFGRAAGVSSCPSVSGYQIHADAGAGGNISPSGVIEVQGGGRQSFTIIPDTGYSVQDVIVNDTSIGAVLSYTFSNIDRNHTIQANFELNTSPPVADAGANQSVDVGDTVTLDGSNSRDTNDGIVSYGWVQTNGPQTTLSAENTAKPTFVATPTMVNSSLTFQLTVYDTGGDSDSDTVQVEIFDNGITGFPAEAITFYTFAGQTLAIKVDEGGGTLTRLYSIDPASDSLDNRSGMPQNLIYGLIDFEIKVANPGDETHLTIYLPEAIPDGYQWFKYDIDAGWYDYSDHVTLNTAGDQARLTLVDGNIGDGDKNQDGLISDPLGLGTLPASTTAAEPSGGGGGGCFIASAVSGPMSKSAIAGGLASRVLLILGYGLIMLRSLNNAGLHQKKQTRIRPRDRRIFR